MSKAVMQQALEALEGLADYRYTDRVKNTMASLRQALAEPEQEPVACISAEQLSKMFHRLEGIDQNQWGYHWKKGWNDALRQAMDYCQTAPIPRKPLTDKEIEVAAKSVPAAVYELMYGHEITVEKFRAALAEFARAIERAHGIGEQQ